MPTLTCPGCGATGEIPASAVGKTVRCPDCRTRVRVEPDAPRPAAPEPDAPAACAPAARSTLSQDCGACGKTLRAPRELLGRRVRCTGCGEAVRIGAAPRPAARPTSGRRSDAARTASATQTQSASAAQSASASQGSASGRRALARALPLRLRLAGWGLLLCFLPLLLLTAFPSNGHERRDRFERAVREHESSFQDLPPGATLSDVLIRLPDRRIPGALLAHDSKLHWLFALASGAVFLALATSVFRHARTDISELAAVTLFTGTVGIILLLVLQVLAGLITAFAASGDSALSLLVYIVNWIGYCYREAQNPTAGALDSIVGFIFSVGVCEELCKALPLIWLLRRRKDLDWSTLCVVGLASGVGFGVFEGIHYSAETYNGIHGGPIYLVRFVSCVALHACFTATVGLLIARNQAAFRAGAPRLRLFAGLCEALWVSVLLHGLYDALLKLEHPFVALACGVAGVAYLAHLVRRETLGLDRSPAPAPAPAPAPRAAASAPRARPALARAPQPALRSSHA
ncbi:MAG: PrsW family glutamic-type intramembrane protease [Planctomycetota bacterium]